MLSELDREEWISNCEVKAVDALGLKGGNALYYRNCRENMPLFLLKPYIYMYTCIYTHIHI